jgi:hypothetical protein
VNTANVHVLSNVLRLDGSRFVTVTDCDFRRPQYRGAGLGGEQSGHVLFKEQAAGDGLLTGMRLLEVVAATATPLRDLRRVMVDYPQVLRNVHVPESRNASRGRAGVGGGATHGEAPRSRPGAGPRQQGYSAVMPRPAGHGSASIADDLVVAVRRSSVACRGPGVT